MRLIINIDSNTYKMIKDENMSGNPWEISCAIENGTPIPDNATNGDLIEVMFPDAEIHIDGNDVFIHHMGFWIKCNIRWWNAPYQKGGNVE